MKRRDFVVSTMAGGMMLGRRSARAGARPSGLKRGTIKKLVVLFQRGGNDGLNTMIPVDPGEYALYQNLRPSLAVPQTSMVNLPGAGFFGLHQAMQALVPMINAGDVSLIHAVGYPNPDRSHFESQAYYETAVPGNGLLNGWLNRYLSLTTGPGLIRGISIGSNIPQSVTGSVPVPVSDNFGRLDIGVDPYLEGPDADAYKLALRDLYQLPPTPGNQTIYDTGGKIFQMIENFSDRDWQAPGFTPDNGAVYPNNSLGRKVMHAAQMLKDDTTFLGIEVVTIDQGGYDTHATQVNPANALATNQGQPRLLEELAQCMSAFYTDMGPTRMQDTLFLVLTEFGRRAYENDSLGTDHGTGALVMAMGPPLNGGYYNGDGDWPGLGSLYRGDDLMWVTDFRDIYWEILANHMGVDAPTLGNIIPGHAYSPVGFIS